MKKTIRQMLTLILIISVTLQMSIVAFAAPSIPKATSDFYVNDFAGVFSEEEKLSLMDRAVDLADTTDGIQVVITTVASLDGNTVEDYANAMYNQYEIGKNDMGLLILLSTGDRKIRVEVGKAMETYFNDAKAGRFIDSYAIPKLKDNKFNEGLISLQTELINEVRACIDKGNVTAEVSKPKESKPIVINWSAIFLIVAGIVIIGGFIFVVIIIYKKTKKIQELEQENAQLVDDNQKAKVEAEKRFEQLEKRYHDKLSETTWRANESLNQTICDYERRYDDLSSKLKDVQNQKQTLTNQLEKLQADKSALSKSLDILRDRYNRVNTLYPTADEDVTRMIEDEIREHDMEEAAKADIMVNEALLLTADRSIIPKIQKAQRAYNALSDAQRQYAKADVGKLNDLCEQSMRLQYQFLASEAMTAITEIIAGITVGKEADIDKLSRAKFTYDNLEYAAKQYVDKSIPENISTLLSQAKRDKKEREEKEEAERKRKEAEERQRQKEAEEKRRKEEAERKRQEEEERRRKRQHEEEERRKKRQREEEERRRNFNNHNRFGGGSSGGFGGFGGFGGHSGGGGASRGF